MRRVKESGIFQQGKEKFSSMLGEEGRTPGRTEVVSEQKANVMCVHFGILETGQQGGQQ